MYTELSIGLGILMKLYDELIDLHIHISDTILESIKGMITGLFTLLSVKDFNFSFLTWIAFIGNYFVGGVDTPFWKSFALFSFITSILFYQTMNLTNNFIIFGFVFLFTIVVEPCVFPEETSNLKTFARLLTCGMILILKQTSIFDVASVYNKIVSFILGYFSTSIVLQFLYTIKEAYPE